jgi:hypothetical protein
MAPQPMMAIFMGLDAPWTAAAPERAAARVS